MALKIIVNISKKVPITGRDYASTSASCTLEGEIATGQDPQPEAARLYRQAEQAVDTQLRLVTDSPAGPPVPATSPGPRDQAGRPYQRRRPALITTSQRSLITKLLGETGTDVAAVLAHFQVGRLDDLSCQDASTLIDQLKSRQPGGTRA